MHALRRTRYDPALGAACLVWSDNREERGLMPGDDAAYKEDIVRLSPQEHKDRLDWCLTAFSAAERARNQYEDRWIRYYKLYRSYVRRDPKNWRSAVFMPICFYVIETVSPRVIAQLPDFTVDAISEEDVPGAEMMEDLLDWCSEKTDLFEQLVITTKDALMFGTGILKTFHKQDIRKVRRYQQQMAPQTLPVPGMGMMPPGMTGMGGMGPMGNGNGAGPVLMDPMTGAPFADMNGKPMTNDVAFGEAPQQTSSLEDVTFYDGPAAESIDPFDFWVAPEATCMEDARFVVHRTFKDMDYVRQRIKDGIYSFPEQFDFERFSTVEDPQFMRRLESIGLDVSRDPSRRVVEVKEFWTHTEVITMLNDSAVVRVQRNPFDHGDKPFIRIVDQLVPHEFWGIGEIEPIEGLQDVFNALVNTRIDNVKLVLNSMFAVNIDHIFDLRDLKVRPGGIIRVREPGLPVNQVFQRIDLGDVTASSFEETQMVQDMVERVSGVSGYQLGTNAPSMNDTASGVNIITEQGNARFGLKLKLAEIIGFRKLARHFGSILQQFMPPSMAVRLKGEAAQSIYQNITPESITGAFDYAVEPQSSSVTESVRKEQAMTLFQTLAGATDEMGGVALDVRSLAEGVLKAFNIKDVEKYILPKQQMQAPTGPTMGLPPGEAPTGPPVPAQMPQMAPQQ